MSIGGPGPAPHVFPHVREAIRAWYAHRSPDAHARPALGSVRGKGPTPRDALRVGRVLRGNLELTRRQLGVLVRYARGGNRTYDDETKALVQRTERWLRKLGIVAKATPRLSVRRDSWQTSDGETVESTYCVEIS